MTNNNVKLNSALRDEAIRLGLCKQWQRDWKRDWDIDLLLDKYKEGIDFCISNGYPSINFIKENFAKDDLRRHNILVDDKWSLLNPRTAVIQGNSTSTARYNGWTPGTIYILNNSNAKVFAKNSSFVILHLFDNARVSCEAVDKAKIVVLRHSIKTIVEDCRGNAAVRDEIGYLDKKA